MGEVIGNGHHQSAPLFMTVKENRQIPSEDLIVSHFDRTSTGQPEGLGTRQPNQHRSGSVLRGNELRCWFVPFSVPNWAVIGFVLVVLFPLAVVLSVRRIRLEGRLARTVWLALTRK